MPRLSLSMIVKNESNNLEKCLSSVKDLADEIVIVDTGSTDNTKDIASKFTSRIYTYEWDNDFSAARNFALGKCTGNWVLYLDADEYIDSNSVEMLKSIINKQEKLGVKCLIENKDDFNNKPMLQKYTRLFTRSDAVKFSGKVHEQIDDSLIKNGYRFVDTNIKIIHTGYNQNKDILIEKARRNLDLLLSDYENNGSSYYDFQIGNTYKLLEENDKAAVYYHRAFTSEDLNKEYRALSSLHIVSSLLDNLQISEALEIIKKGIALDSTQPVLYLAAADVFFRSGNVQQAIEYSLTSIKKNKLLKQSETINGELKILADELQLITFGMYICLESNLDYNLQLLKKELRIVKNYSFDSIQIDSIELIEKLLEGKADIDAIEKEGKSLLKENYLNFLTSVSKKIENPDDRKTYLKLLNNHFPDDVKILIRLGNLFEAEGDVTEAIEKYEAGLQKDNIDPALIFYLLSAYIKMNEFEKIPELIEKAEQDFGLVPEVMNKLNAVKQKLSGFYESMVN
ncbi:MAG: glycosyltransferase [Melioribacteraceae bacterium]|nr:glycosyltransferase [Melioribacteraceae bacterium]MCF8353756.1 glycosyltransferase [Melioribacteraceae bacterium]MCF8392435.1 glycosyltransferase [Melioribacteraceae bacterium]MCF8418346.1 glycosyltransferase [Melioribacteraceae bacterium]